LNSTFTAPHQLTARRGGACSRSLRPRRGQVEVEREGARPREIDLPSHALHRQGAVRLKDQENLQGSAQPAQKRRRCDRVRARQKGPPEKKPEQHSLSPQIGKALPLTREPVTFADLVWSRRTAWFARPGRLPDSSIKNCEETGFSDCSRSCGGTTRIHRWQWVAPRARVFRIISGGPARSCR